MANTDHEQEVVEYEFRANPENEPIDIGNILADTGEAAELIPAEKLKGETFYIIRMNRFKSRFQGQEYAFHCICSEIIGDDFFRTVLGGEAVVRHLNLICELGLTNPVRVTLKFLEGGRYGGYYVLE